MTLRLPPEGELISIPLGQCVTCENGNITANVHDYDGLLYTDIEQKPGRSVLLVMKASVSMRAHLCCCLRLFRMIAEASKQGDTARVQSLINEGQAFVAENELLGLVLKHLMFTDEELESPTEATLEKMFGVGRLRLAGRS